MNAAEIKELMNCRLLSVKAIARLSGLTEVQVKRYRSGLLSPQIVAGLQHKLIKINHYVQVRKGYMKELSEWSHKKTYNELVAAGVHNVFVQGLRTKGWYATAYTNSQLLVVLNTLRGG